MKNYYEMIEPIVRRTLSPVFTNCLDDLSQQLATQEGKFFVFVWRSGCKCIEVGRTKPWINPELLDLTSSIIIAHAGKVRLINKNTFSKKYM
jgi:hypothetical protein